MDKRVFRHLVVVNALLFLTLSVTGMIDCAVVGHFLGEDGLAAMKIAMPVFSVLSFFSTVMSSGMSILVSRELTQGRREGANQVIGTVVLAGLLLAALCLLAGLLIPDTLVRIFGGKHLAAPVFAAARAYMVPILFAALPILFYDLFGALLLLEGADRYLKYASCTILVVDTAGDLLAVLLGAGLGGIAAASAAAYLFAAVVLASFYLRGRSMFRFHPQDGSFRQMPVVVRAGLPMGLFFLCDIFWPLLVNRLMLVFGTMPGLAALSIQDAVRYLPGAFCYGIANTALLLTGIFAGEQDGTSLAQMRKRILAWGLIGGETIAVVLGLAAPVILRCFTSDPQIAALGVSALRWYLLGIPFLSVNYALASVLQGLGKNRLAAAFILLNHLLLPVLLAWLLGARFGTQGIYASYGLCEIAALAVAIMAALFLRSKVKESPWITASWEPIVDELRMPIRSEEEAVLASQKVAAFCQKHGLPPADGYHIALCVEELAVNSLEHGFKDGGRHQLELRLLLHEQSLILRLRDDGRPFDLVERYKMAAPDDPTKNIGLRLVFAAADSVEYSSALNWNNVCVRIRTSRME